MSYNKDFDGQVKFTFQPRYGFRAWKTGLSFTRPSLDFTPRLESLSYDYEWTPGENVAHCKASTPYVCPVKHQHTANCPRKARCERPRIGCGCGFWSYATEDYWSAGTPVITGVVEAWDRVIVGPKGMRSSRARIVALARTLIVSDAWVTSHTDPDIDALTDHIHEGLLRYDVPIFDSVRSMLDAFPLTPPPPPKEAAA